MKEVRYFHKPDKRMINEVKEIDKIKINLILAIVMVINLIILLQIL